MSNSCGTAGDGQHTEHMTQHSTAWAWHSFMQAVWKRLPIWAAAVICAACGAPCSRSNPTAALGTIAFALAMYLCVHTLLTPYSLPPSLPPTPPCQVGKREPTSLSINATLTAEPAHAFKKSMQGKRLEGGHGV